MEDLGQAPDSGPALAMAAIGSTTADERFLSLSLPSSLPPPHIVPEAKKGRKAKIAAGGSQMTTWNTDAEITDL